LAILNVGDKADPNWLGRLRQDGDTVYVLAPRGVGPTQWTRRNPPNTVERSHVLLGRTVDGGRVQDIAAAARYLKAKGGGKTPVFVAGRGAGAVLAAYAALLEPDIAGAVLEKPPLTHMAADAPQFLNVLRVCDVPDALGMLAPRPLEIRGVAGADAEKVAAAYAAAGKPAALVVGP
jgi:pimeloyl-ACP methyl ester carboxylesterase